MSVPLLSSSGRQVVIVIFASCCVTLMIVVILYFVCDKYAKLRWRSKISTGFEEETWLSCKEFRKFERKVKGLIVEENGRDVVYVRDLEDGKLKAKFTNILLNPSFEEEEDDDMKNDVITEVEQISEPEDVKAEATESVKPSTPPPPPPLLASSSVPPPPPPPPPLTWPMPKRHCVPVPKAGELVSSLRPPSIPRSNTNNKDKELDLTEESSKGTSGGNMKLKPFHWDKVMATGDHSMVWNEIIDGSLRFDDNEIETLFGYTTTNRRTAQENSITGSSAGFSTQIFILEARKSQNTAIVLKSLAVSRKEIMDALIDGLGLATDVLEKLSRITPTKEEEAKIVGFRGNPSKLADAESFLYYILKAVPSAFTRINAMLFRSNYDTEIRHLNESLQTLELGCKELRTRGLFLKLLEAILKAGNRMNAGTSRGNARGFDLMALRKISDVKSTDGRTTLLHFVVEQVVRSEGRRRMLYQNTSSGIESEAETDKEHLLLGLQGLREMSIEFSNVKKAANLDYDNFNHTCSNLNARVSEIRLLISQCGNGEQGGFFGEMERFTEETEEEIKVVAAEQTRIMGLVKRTTDYYQAGGPKQDRANLLQLFVIVKDFLHKVDQVCMDISQKMQQNKVAAATGSASPPSLQMISSVKFQSILSHQISNLSSSCESDDDF